MAQSKETRCQCQDQGFEIFGCRITDSADIAGGDKGENILCGFGKRPELACYNCAWEKGYLDPVNL